MNVNGLVFAPALGWIVAISLCVVMLTFAVLNVVLHVRRRANSDETLAACIRRTLICVLVAILALTPSTVIESTSRAINTTDVVMAVDVTGSMAVKDASYGSSTAVTRLDATRSAIDDLTSMYANSSFAAVKFGTTGTLDVPLTPDQLAITNWADTLSVEPSSVSGGSSLDAPLDRLLLTLKSIREDHPNDSIILYLFSDGEQTSSEQRRTYSSLRAYVDDAFTVGVGSTQGGQVPYVSDGVSTTDPSHPWVIDPTTGKPGISKLDEANLKQIADELSGTYLHVNAQQTMRNGLSDERSQQWRITQTPKEHQRMSPVTWPFAIALSVLLLWEGLAWIATTRRLL